MSVRRHILGSFAILLVCSSIGRADEFVATYTESAAYAPLIANKSLLENASGDDGNGECAATSMINSFMFLQQQYPSIYGTSAGTPNALTTMGGMVDSTSARNALHNSIASPALQGNVLTAKQNWINTYAPGTTSIVGISSFSPPGTLDGGTAAQGYSSSAGMTFGASGSNILAFLTQQIKEGEDVEIGLFAHMMTLVGVGTDTTTNMPAIEYIDPNAPATDSWSALSFVGSDGQYAISITGSGYGPPKTFDDMGNPLHPTTLTPLKSTTRSPRVPLPNLPFSWQ